MARLFPLVLLVGMVNYSYAYWLAWRSSPVDNGQDLEGVPNDGCSGTITDVECRVVYTKQPWDEIAGVDFRDDWDCSTEHGLHCRSGPGDAPCPDFEVRYFCTDLSVDPAHQWLLADGFKQSDPRSAEEYCNSLNPNPIDYHVVENNGTFALVPAPEVVNYACAISTGSGAYIDLTSDENSCISNPSVCPGGHSTWSVWLKMNHGDNDGPVTFLSSGTATNTGVVFSRLTDGTFQCGVADSSGNLMRNIYSSSIPDGSWFHLAIVIDSSTHTLEVYVNGSLVDDNPTSVTVRTSTVMPPGDDLLTLGTNSGQKGQEVATCAYSDFAIYEQKLTLENIMEIYNCGVFGAAAGVRVMWSIQQMESTNPNELRYQCLLRTKNEFGHGGKMKWYVLSSDDLENKPEPTETDPSRHHQCFFKSELIVNKYELFKQEHTVPGTIIMCEVALDEYELLEIGEALTYEWTPWYSSSNSQDNPVGDNETLANILQVYQGDGCAYPVEIECRERYSMKSLQYLEANEGVITRGCDLTNGLICLHDAQDPGMSCPDFEVRFMCAGDRKTIEIEYMRIQSLSSESLQAECRIEEDLGMPHNFAWSLYNISSGLSSNLTGASGAITGVHIDTVDGDRLSKLTVDDPLSKDLLGLFVVCSIFADGLSSVYDALRIDDVFYGTVVVTSNVAIPTQYGTTVHLICTADGDTVHSMEWYWTPLTNTSYRDGISNPPDPYIRSAYIGGSYQLEIPDFQSENAGVYFCVINWGSAEANLTLEGEEIEPTTLALTTAEPTTTSHPTTPSLTTAGGKTTSAMTEESVTSKDGVTLGDDATFTGVVSSSPLANDHSETALPTSAVTPESITTEEGTRSSQVGVTSGQTSSDGVTSSDDATQTIPDADVSTPHTRGGSVLPFTTDSGAQGVELSTSEMPFTTDSSLTVTPSWCALADVVDLQTAIECGDASRIDAPPGKLTDAKKEELLNFLTFIVSEATEQPTTFSETAAVTKVVLMVFSKLTDPEQSLSIEDDAAILAVTEEALEVLAGTLLPTTCGTFDYQTSSANLCNLPSLDLLSGYSFTHTVPLNHNDAGDVTDTFEESLEFDLSQEDLDGTDVNVVVLRKEKSPHSIDKVKYIQQTDNLRPPNETWIQLNSALLTLSVFVQGNRTSVPVTFSLYHLQDVNDESVVDEDSTVNITRNSICAFIDEEDEEDTYWSSWGCEVLWDKSTKKYSSCACNHSTNFAVLMQVKSYEISHADSLALTWITYIGCGTSVVMLVLTLAVFIYLGRMLRSDRCFIHTNLSVAILVAQILFIAGIDRTENRGVCKAVALLLHFCYLSVFAWMLVEGVHLYMKIVKVYGSENIKMYPYLFIGWGIPTVITLISFGASNDGYGTGNSCWLDTSSGLIWAFVAPALLVIVINMIVLAMVVRIIIKSAHLRQEKKYDHIKAGIKGAVMLLPILGLTWVFGLLAVNSATIVFQYLFTIFNSFQGLFIFLINCAFNSEVRTAFVRKREKQKLARDRETMEHSMSFVYTTKKSTGVANTGDSRRQAEHDRKEEYTDLTSLRSASPSSRPGSGASLLDVTQRKHLKRPHSGKVSPMPVAEEIDQLESI